MQIGVMITNGGPHPPQKWAEQSADRLVDIIEIEPTALQYEQALQAKNILREKLVAGLLEPHTAAQIAVRANIEAPHDALASDHFAKSLHVVQDVVKGSMFEQHFGKPEILEFVRQTLLMHFNTVAHIEQSWHRDRQGA
jgi:hypothetical protein